MKWNVTLIILTKAICFEPQTSLEGLPGLCGYRLCGFHILGFCKGHEPCIWPPTWRVRSLLYPRHGVSFPCNLLQQKGCIGGVITHLNIDGHCVWSFTSDMWQEFHMYVCMYHAFAFFRTYSRIQPWYCLYCCPFPHWFIQNPGTSPFLSYIHVTSLNLTCHLCPDDGGSRFLWGIGDVPDYTVSRFTYYEAWLWEV